MELGFWRVLVVLTPIILEPLLYRWMRGEDRPPAMARL
jgi:hypothetical protein